MIFRLLVMVVFCVSPVITGAEDDFSRDVQSLVDKVDARYSKIKDFRADFTQETRIEGFDSPLTSSGRVFIKKPGLLRWDYEEPSIEHIVVNGDNVQMFVPEYNQVIRGSLTRMAATKGPLQLLQGAGKLAEQFAVKPTGDGERGQGGLPLLTLIPKKLPGQESPISHIVSEIQPKTFLIQTVSLFETSGNISTFRFNNLRANTGLDRKAFSLDLPKDVVVVDDVLPQ
jgi:outer membrane lipoprotein carrier protein